MFRTRTTTQTVRILFILFLLVLAVATLPAQMPLASGSVTDVHADPVAGARIRCGGQATITDRSGKFSLDASGCTNLTITADGFEAMEIAASAETAVVLHPSSVFAAVDVAGATTTVGDSAASVTSVDRRTLDTSGALTLDDRLRQVPGFSLFRRTGSRVANPTTQGVSLRGVGASGASRAAVLKDGIPLNDPFGSWVFWGRVPAESISEVEIVRGPASDLYGTAAVGGVVSVRTREIGPAAFSSIDLSYGSQQTPFGSSYSSAKWKYWGGSLAAEYLKTNGYIPVAPEQRGAVDTLANVRRSSIVPMVERRFDGSDRIFGSAEFYSEVRANGTPLQRNDTRITNFVAGADLASWRSSVFTLRAFGGTENYHQSFSSIAADRQSESLTRLQTVPSQNFGLSGRWTTTFKQNTFFAGAEYRNIRGRSDETGFSNGNATVATSAGGREALAAAYTGISFRATDRLTLNGGLRYDRWRETKGFSASRSLITQVLTMTSFPDRGRSALSPRGSMLFKINHNLSLAASAAGGFRQPTLNELYRSFRLGNILTLANENLRAEKAANFEVALIVNALDERFYVRAGPFCTRVSDTVTNVTLTIVPNLITRQRQNLGMTRSCGVEADAAIRATPSLTFTAGYLHVHAKVTAMPGNAALVGLRLPQVPRDQGTFRAQYSRIKLGTFSMQLRASGEQFEDDQNLLPLKGYLTADVYASHDVTHRFVVYFAGENIFDTSIEAGRTPVVTLAQPRNFRIGLRLRLGRD